MNIGASQLHETGLDELPGILSKQDQRKAFGKAKRHTYGVKALKLLMPLLSLTIISLYFIPNAKIPLSLDIPVTIEGIDLSSKGLKMINPRYSGGSDKTGYYKIEADYALQQISQTHILELHKISGALEQANNKWTRLSATKGIYDTKTEKMNLQDDILISTNQGMQVKMQSADIDMKKQLIRTDKPIYMTLNGNIIEAQSMVITGKQKRVLFSGGVKVKLYKNKTLTK